MGLDAIQRDPASALKAFRISKRNACCTGPMPAGIDPQNHNPVVPIIVILLVKLSYHPLSTRMIPERIHYLNSGRKFPSKIHLFTEIDDFVPERHV